MQVVRTVEEAADRSYAYIICAFKCIPDITTTPALLAPILSRLAADPSTSTTSFVLLQNGIGIEDDLLEAVSKISAPTVVISGCCWVDTTAVDGGKKVAQHGNEKLILGYHQPGAAAGASQGVSEHDAKGSLDTLVSMFRAAGSDAEAAPDADVARWRKVLWYVEEQNWSLGTNCQQDLTDDRVRIAGTHPSRPCALSPARTWVTFWRSLPHAKQFETSWQRSSRLPAHPSRLRRR